MSCVHICIVHYITWARVGVYKSSHGQDTYHDALGKIGLGKDDGAHGFEHRDQDAILEGRAEGPPNVAQRAVVSLDVELVLESHWHAVERPHQAAILLEKGIELLGSFKGIVKEDLGQAASVSKGGGGGGGLLYCCIVLSCLR